MSKELFQSYIDAQQAVDRIVCLIDQRNVQWQHLAAEGLVVLATKAYRKQHNCGLKEAHDAVNTFRNQLKL